MHENRNHTSFYSRVLKIQPYLRLAVRRDTISPATEKTRSAGVDVAVMARYFLGSLANKGNLCPLTFHQSIGEMNVEETAPV